MTTQALARTETPRAAFGGEQLVTFRIGDQVFGIDALKVRDVLRPQAITRVPLAASAVFGSINLRGHIVTAVDVRTCLGLPPKDDSHKPMCVVADVNGEAICLLVDSVGDVITVHDEDIEPNPSSLHPSLGAMSRGIHPLKDGLLIILDIDQLVTW